MEVGRYYQRAGQWLAATYRFRSVVDGYQTTTHAPEALERLVECYLALGIPEEARKSAAVLGANYPETYWYRQSLRLLIKEQQHSYGRAYATASAAGPGPTSQAPQQGTSANAYPAQPPAKKKKK